MTKDNQDQEDVIVTFNGKNHKLKDWIKIEKAAVDDDSSLNWKKVFEEHTPKPNLGESAPTGFVPYKKIKKKRKAYNAQPLALIFKQFWVPFLSAIIVGLGIGFTVLIMFSSHKSEKPAVVSDKTPAVPANATGTAVETLDGSSFSVSFQVVQDSSYETTSAANVRMGQLKDQNIPAAVFPEGGKYKVMIGLADDEATRQNLTKEFKDKDLKDLYGKAFVFTPKSIKTSKQVGQFLSAGKSLMTQMVPLSAAKEMDQKVDKKALAMINDKLSQWADISELNVKGSLKKDLTLIRGTVESAYSHLENAEDSDSGQQSLLDALSTYAKILNALSA